MAQQGGDAAQEYSLRDAYEQWALSHAQVPPIPQQMRPPREPEGLRVGIVGAGMAGLYAALLLQKRGAQVTVLESEFTRVGGRILTHRFTDDADQYYEAGAMRLPELAEHKPVFDLIKHLNKHSAAADKIELIDYVISDPSGNRVLVNDTRDNTGKVMTLAYANAHPGELGFGLPGEPTTAAAMLEKVIRPFADLLKKDFKKGFEAIVQFDNFSFYGYLTTVCGWSPQMVNYVEVMTSQTNQFQASFPEIVIESIDFGEPKWKTVKDGMDRLPKACADLVGRSNIVMGARVRALFDLKDGTVCVDYVDADDVDRSMVFDKVIAAVPPAVLRMWRTPRWSPAKEQAVRAMNYQPLYKIGLRFRERFWEKGDAQKGYAPVKGGQSITDLPSRWVVYPSNGIGSAGAGVLLHYAWMTDAYTWLPQSPQERIRLALRDLQALHPEADVESLFLQAHDVAWANRWAAGDAKFLPGQFREMFAAGRAPERNIHFAGEHLSVHHTWIVGALDSAKTACEQILGGPIGFIGPSASGRAPRRGLGVDYTWTHGITPVEITGDADLTRAVVT
ncbi:flavin monoamine oxidase family protein [Nocardiopsis sediminis]|uniref:Flavin monoamine oxidase family protein n=1 Tax=Nocardiopsis sediminis TaxID=1778267 RepID=A0ABV8FN30_9ACTN